MKEIQSPFNSDQNHAHHVVISTSEQAKKNFPGGQNLGQNSHALVLHHLSLAASE